MNIRQTTIENVQQEGGKGKDVRTEKGGSLEVCDERRMESQKRVGEGRETYGDRRKIDKFQLSTQF